MLSWLFTLHFRLPVSTPWQGLRVQDRRWLFQFGFCRRREKMQVPQALGELPGMSRSTREDLPYLRRDRSDLP